MNRLVSALKHFAELYLIIAGGGYTLASLVALSVNTRALLTSADRVELRDLRADLGENCFILVAAGLTLTAGLGIHKYRWWGLLLAAVLGALAVAGGLVWSVTDPWEYHNFTIALPMAAILVWAILPPTWVQFKRQSVKAS